MTRTEQRRLTEQNRTDNMDYSNFTHDFQNANKGTQRGRGLLEKSLRQYGAGRSVLSDKDGYIIAGNNVMEVAADLELPLRVVETDGNELVVVRRTDLDLDSKEGAGLAIADNRTSEVGLDWDIKNLLDLSANGMVDLMEFWHPSELEKLIGLEMEEAVGVAQEKSEDINEKHDTECPECGYKFRRQE